MKHGIKNIRDIEKSTIEGIVQVEELGRSYKILPKFIREKCVGCQRCFVSCNDGGHQAITIVDGRPVLNPEKCVSCHLCVLVCPQQAIVSSEIHVPK